MSSANQAEGLQVGRRGQLASAGSAEESAVGECATPKLDFDAGEHMSDDSLRNTFAQQYCCRRLVNANLTNVDY
jgi:hypothetical protein